MDVKVREGTGTAGCNFSVVEKPDAKQARDLTRRLRTPKAGFTRQALTPGPVPLVPLYLLMSRASIRHGLRT